MATKGEKLWLRPAPPKPVIAYQPYLGSGVYDVCNRPLGSIKAYIVSNPVFYSSKAYRTYFKQASPWMTDADIERMKQQDHSPSCRMRKLYPYVLREAKKKRYKNNLILVRKVL